MEYKLSSIAIIIRIVGNKKYWPVHFWRLRNSATRCRNRPRFPLLMTSHYQVTSSAHLPPIRLQTKHPINIIHQHFKIRTRLYHETPLRKRQIHKTTCFSKEWRGDPFTKTYELSTRDILFINLIYPIRCISHIIQMVHRDKLSTQ